MTGTTAENLDFDHLRSWIGREQMESDRRSRSQVQR